MNEYYVFWGEKTGYSNNTFAVSIGKLSPDQIELFINLVEEAKAPRISSCLLGEADDIPQAMPNGWCEVQKKRSSYSRKEQILLSRMLDPYANYTADYLQSVADEVRKAYGKKQYKESESAQNEGEQEYYVSYTRTIYPDECREASDCDREHIEIQKKKDCFASSCGD